MSVRHLAAAAVLAAAASRAAAQAPGTDIYLAPLTSRAQAISVGAPENVTRRPGYDNQPCFLPDGSGFLYTSTREDGQADTYRYDLATGAIRRVTATPESEYSPTLLPLGPGFSVVRVEADSSQRLWAFAPDGSGPHLLLPDVKPVGYHAWSEQGDVVLFVLGTPPALQLVPAGTLAPVEVARGIGRALAPVPGQRRILFTRRHGDAWVISSLDLDDRSVTPIIRTPANDFFAFAGGILFAADSSRILVARPGADTAWTALADFSAAGIRGITRIAVSPLGDRIAFVAEDRR